ncbi:MAG: response regulator transcription factor [Oligoflexia bacterium]|nr:response regulator transcription factor [Oligoflexia bacterium]
MQDSTDNTNLNKKILIIEDDKDISEMLTIHLNKHHPCWNVDLINSGDEARLFFKLLNDKKMLGNLPDICILDIMLPGNNGFEICKFVRSHSLYNNLPILMLTALSTPEYIIQGLEAGADDYVTKPFDINVLSARIKTLLKKKDFIANNIILSSNQKESSKVNSVNPNERLPDLFTFGGENGLRMYLSQYRVSKGPLNSPEEIVLTLTEFKILLQLIKSGGKVLTRKFLLSVIIGDGVHVTERTIDTHVVSLRKKLSDFARYIETVRGIGYRMVEP